MQTKYYSIHVFYSRKSGFSVPFETDVEGEDEIIIAAVKAGILDEEDADSVDSVDEIDENEFNLMGGTT
jgi:hypothetical protein